MEEATLMLALMKPAGRHPRVVPSAGHAELGSFASLALDGRPSGFSANISRSTAFPLLAILGTGRCFSMSKRRRRGVLGRCTSMTCHVWQTRRAAQNRLESEKDSLDFEVAPWVAGVESRPIFAVSDSTGIDAKRLATCAWAQFGFAETAQLTVRSEVRSDAEVKRVVEEAKAAGGASGAMIIYTLASPGLCTTMASECREQDVACIDVLQPLLAKMEEQFKQPRLGSDTQASSSGAVVAATSKSPLAIYAVSDSTGKSVSGMTRAALRQFPTVCIEEITVCPEVRSLEEIRLVAKTAGKEQGLVAFSFASTGMSRFMRQQCEMAGAHYVDLYQPLLLAMEVFLDYPAIGVTGGYLDSDALTASEKKWKRQVV